jgi:hypothetical protein
MLSLTPALSPRRGRIIRRVFENAHDWICHIIIHEPMQVRLFPLLGGEGQGEGGLHTIFVFDLLSFRNHGATSLTTSAAFLSSRNPRKTGWRRF